MKRAILLLVLAASAIVLVRHRPARGLRVATFNIELYGWRDKRTDDERLVRLLESLDADVIAVQEIADPVRFNAVVGRMRGERRFVSSACGGRSGLRVGFVWDASRVALDGVREFPELAPDGDGGCDIGDRPGLLGAFSDGKDHFELLVVHLAPMPERAARRREQWERALAIVARERAAGRAIAVLGDANSTGFRDDGGGERTFLRERLRAARLRLTTELDCSAYYASGGQLGPSMLDHIAVSDGFPSTGKARAGGYCAETACRPLALDEAPRDFRAVSDHCPVSLGE